MSLNHQCPGLINSISFYDNGSNFNNFAPLRVAVLKGCHLTLVDYFNIIMKAMKRPFVMTYCNAYHGSDNSIWNELLYNRSEFSLYFMEYNFPWYTNHQLSPTFYFANAVTILSGKILANNGNSFTILNSFSLELWLLLCALFVVIAICHEFLNKKYSKWISLLIDVLGEFSKLWAVFINQSNQFGNICCVKHLILNSVTVISIFIITLFFTSEILSNLLFHPLVKIDTLDDLVKFVTQHQDVKLISDNVTSSWSSIRNWKGERAQFIFSKMNSVKIYQFDYKQVYHGKSIILSFDSNFERMLKSHRDLSFHMSADRLFGLYYGIIYSKYIDIKTKRFIDSIMTSLFESGIYNFVEERKGSKRLNIVEDDPPQTISLSYFKKIVFIYMYNIIILLIILVVEILLFLLTCKNIRSQFKHSKVSRRECSQVILLSKNFGKYYSSSSINLHTSFCNQKIAK